VSDNQNVERKLAELTRRDPLAFALTHVDLLDNKKWELDTRAWLPEIFNQVNPWVVEKNPTYYPTKTLAVIKSTQAGITTLAISKALHFLSNWTVRVGYMLPRWRDLQDFASTRLDPIIKTSPYLRSIKKPEPDNASVKAINNSYLFFMEGTVEPRSMPIDMLLVDEVDLCDPPNVGTAINRMDASPWKLLTYLSTPTLPNTGIDAIYQTSDQREWTVHCTCGHWQIMDWDKHLRIRGNPNDPEDVWFACEKCDRVLTVHDIQNGEWIAQMPSQANTAFGYHIHQMLTTSARELYKHYRDPTQSIAEFWRKRLGKTYTMQGGSVTRDDILINCFTEPYEMQPAHDGGGDTYVMGADQGNRIHVVIGKIPKGKKSIQVVWVETIPLEKGFDRLKQLVKLFRIKRGVVDRNPNAHEVKKMVDAFPSRILAADYNEDPKTWDVKKDEKGNPVAVGINRTMGFDDLLESIGEGRLSLPGTPPRLHQEVESVIDHVTSIKRDEEERKTASGVKNVFVYRKLRSADHYAHALSYMNIAAKAAMKGGSFRSFFG
jgi:hypothetical protein